MASSSDYVVRFTGKDDLSGTVNKVKSELEGVGRSTSQIDKIQQKFERITKGTAPLKRQLRDLQNLMAKMNFEGLSNTEQFTQIAQEAGRIKDAIADASTATQRFANDTMSLQAGIQALQGIAAAANIATGTMALLGTENEDIARSIQKVQGALALLNGVQTIANALNKDSVLMQKIKQIQLAANTSATARNTVAEGVNTAAIGANTIATKAWNVAKAISKALFGDFTGLLIVGAGALATYAIATDNSTKKTNENTNAVRQQTAEYQAYQNTIKDLTGKFVDLKTQWSNLATATQRNKFIKDNQQAFAALGVEVKNVDDAERLFGNNTQAIVQAMIQRAKYALKYQEAMKLVSQIVDEQAKHNNAVAAGEDEFVHLARANELQGQLNAKVKEMQALAPKMPKMSSGGGSTRRSGGSSGSSSSSNEVKPVAGSIKDLQKQITDLQSKLDNGLIPKDKIAENVRHLNELKDKLEKLKIEIGTADVKKIGAVETPTQSNFTAGAGMGITGISVENINKLKEAQEQLRLDEINSKISETTAKWEGYTDILYGVADATRILGDSQEAQIAQFALNATALVGNAVKTIAVMNAEAMAKGASSAFALPFPYNLAAWGTIAATIGSIFASLPKFADGGVLTGGSHHGDQLLARVNAGEMLLNPRQQNNLFNLIDSGNFGIQNSTINFKLKGSDIYGSIHNYGKTVSKTGKKLNI